MGKPAPAPAMGHRHTPMHDKGARMMHDRGHNMGNHNMGNHRSTDGRLQGMNNAHKVPNREIAQKTMVSTDRPHNNHGGSSHFGGRR